MSQRYSFLRKVRLVLNQILPRKGRFAQIFVTKKCNLRCDYCQVTRRTTEDVPFETWKQIIDKLVRFGASWISITGGEPLLRKDLEEIISRISGLNRIVSLSSNGTLLTQARIDSLAEAGLCFLTLSLDSLDGEKGRVKSDSERVFDLLAYAKKKGIVPEVKCTASPSSFHSGGMIRVAEETTKRGFIFALGIQSAVGGLFSKPSRRSPVIGGMAKNAKGVWLPAGCFQSEILAGASWKCRPKHDAWITINNDGSLMVCQEWGSNTQFLDVNSFRDGAWRKHKQETVEQCPGCNYDCYFEQDIFFHRPLWHYLEELPTSIEQWKMLH